MWGKRPLGSRTREILGRSLLSLLLVFALVSIHACAPARTARLSVPRTSLPPPSPRPRIAVPPKVDRVEEPPARPLLEEVEIKEEDLQEKRPAPQPRIKEQRARPATGREAPPALPEDHSLIAKITPTTAPQRAASLRLTEEGKRLLESGEHTRALARLEKTIAIDSTNPYGYYYLAKAHHHLNRYQESLTFLDIAEPLLASEPYWLAEVFALRGENFRLMGSLQQADSSYSQALRLNPGNRTASEGLSRLRGDAQTSPR